MIRNTRTFARFVWFHVPLRIENASGQEQDTIEVEGIVMNGKEKTEKLKVVNRVMAEKRMALDLVEACVHVDFPANARLTFEQFLRRVQAPLARFVKAPTNDFFKISLKLNID